MEFGVLGPLEVLVDGRPARLGGRKQRVVLARLLLRTNQPVPVDALIDAVWGDDPPEAARNSLQSYISHLRKALGEGRIRSGNAGYALVVEPEEFDVHRFQQLLDRGRAHAEHDPASAVDMFSSALALWRGPALADLSDEPSLAGDIARLEEVRLSAVEHKVDAELACGRHGAVIGELEELVARYPLRERVWEQLILALYRSGRQGEALSTYRRAERTLVEELGIDPSPGLRALNDRVLRQDAQLDPALPAKAPVAVAPGVQAPARARRRRWAAIPLAAIAAGAVAVLVVRDPGSDTLARFEPGMAIIDANTGERVASIPRSIVAQPVEVIFASGSFWVLNIEPLEFVQVDPVDGSVLRRIASPVDDVGYFSVDGNDLWVTHRTEPVLSKVDIERGREVMRVEDLPGKGGSGGVLVADGSLWVARRDADDFLGLVARLNRNTGAPEHLFRRLPGSLALTYGDDGAVWTGGSYGDVNRIDPRTNTVESNNVGGRNFYVTAGGGFGWTTDEAKGVVYQLDGSAEVVRVHRTGLGARSLSFSAGKVWVGNQDDGTVSAIDLATGGTTSYAFGHQLTSIAAGAGRVLVQLLPAPPFEAIVAELDPGGSQTLRLFTGGFDYDPPDPALQWAPFGLQVADATCVGLLRGSTRSQDLEPEVAVEMPTVSQDGLTYTFKVRDGFEFSPPAEGPVTAETIRASIERALSPAFRDAAPARAEVDDIAGQAEYMAGTADHIAGLRVEGNTLSITLVEASTDFLDRLTNPYFCAVPDGTPALTGVGGAWTLIDDGMPNEVAVASAGPYYVARHAHGEYTILRRNPNYRGTRPHRVEVIAIRGGIDTELAQQLVSTGEWDGLTNMFDGDVHVDDTVSHRVSCVRQLPDGIGIDLANLCLAASGNG